MTTLADHISINKSYAAQPNLERDTGTDSALDGYLLTGRALEMVERITARAQQRDGRRVVRYWTVWLG